jgi:hypothetical protein
MVAMTRLACLLLASVAVLWASPQNTPAQTSPGKDRGFTVEKIHNDHPAFMVGIQVDRADRTYEAGEEMRVKVKSEKDGYLYLLYRSADGKTACLFPNCFQKENHIRGGQEITVPAQAASFRFRAGPPYGREVLVALVLAKPLTAPQCGVLSLTEESATPLSVDGVKGMYLTALTQPWAESRVFITTVNKRGAPCQPQRMGLGIGIGPYQDSRVPQLRVCRRDAEEMIAVMKRRCGLDQAIVLVDEQATRANIERAICKLLVERTRPGDIVFIYWSGHGARKRDTSGSYPDGWVKYLVPYDARPESPDETMIEARVFARWLQNLDGRTVVLLLDTCYAGGQGAGGERGLLDPAPDVPFDFLDEELLRVTKSIAQQKIAKLASSRASQRSVVGAAGELSVMTAFLVEMLTQEGGAITIKDAYEYVKVKVPAYVREHYPRLSDVPTPVLIDNTTPPVYLRQ